MKNLCWEKLKDLFVFPDGFDEEVVKDRAFFIVEAHSSILGTT